MICKKCFLLKQYCKCTVTEDSSNTKKGEGPQANPILDDLNLPENIKAALRNALTHLRDGD